MLTWHVCLEEHCSDPNAVFDSCGNVCPRTCLDKDSRHRICPATCLKSGGCVCKPGYVENSQGMCILPEKCRKGSGLKSKICNF